MTSSNGTLLNGSTAFLQDENSSSLQLFAQQPSVSSTTTTASEPDSSSVYSSNSSVESMRDRTHLTLDFKGMKPRNHSAPADSTVSPLSLPRDLIDSILLSPEKFLNLPQSLLAVATAKQQVQQSIAETPTPTKFIYPKNVTKAQEIFAEGFQKALQKVQTENKSIQQTTCSPSTVKYLLSLLTPTLAGPPAPPTLNPSPLLFSNSNGESGTTTSSTSAVTSTTTAASLINSEDNTAVAVKVAESGSNKRKATAASANKKNLDLPTIVVVSTSGQPSPTSSSTSSSSSVNSGSSFGSSVKKKLKVEEKEPAKGKTATELLGEICNKLDPNNAQNYMDLFHHHQQSLGSNFMNSFASNNNNGNTAQSMMQFPHSPPPQHQMAQQHNSPLPLHMIKQENPMANLFQTSMLPPQLNSSSSEFRSSSLRNCSSTASASGSGGGGPIGYGSGSSFDMDDQERKKLERKRARNRQAASKCRQRKMERITELEQQVQIERQRAASLASDVDHLKRTIVELNHQLDRHRTAGCPISIPFKQFLN